MASLVFKHFHVVGDEIKRFGPDLLKESEAGEVARETIGDRLVNFFRKEFNALGGALGYRYEESPICIPDGSPAPEDLVDEYVQTSRPGHRAPHAWIRDGVSTLDLFGEKFTLIRSGGEDRHCVALQKAADVQGVPMNIVTLNDAPIRALYPRNFTLVCPDGHVAWRGDVVDDSAQIILRYRNRGSARVARFSGPFTLGVRRYLSTVGMNSSRSVRGIHPDNTTNVSPPYVQ
jgi:hypothetical protein